MSAPKPQSVKVLSRELILGVGGGISAYKSCELLRRLQDRGYVVSVIPTRNSLNFVGKATWEALSGRPVQDELWNSVHKVPHVNMAKKAAAIVIAPATADLIARIAHGRADDMLTNVVIASDCPIIIVPAMHTEMWLSPATISNVATLCQRGFVVIQPEEGKLTSGDVGLGRYPDIQVIISELETTLDRKATLLGKRVLISAGGTREKIDPVRYVGNNSSGKQGIALAEVAALLGAQTTLILANRRDVELEGIDVVHVESAADVMIEMNSRFDDSDIVVMAAAIADARPEKVSTSKIDTANFQTISLIENPDIIATLALRKTKQFLVGFAAQTGDGGVEKAIGKMKDKNLDLIFMNDVSDGKIFGEDYTQGTLIHSNGERHEFSPSSKVTLAENILQIAANKLG